MTTKHPFPCPTKLWHSDGYDSISPTNPKLSAKGKSVVVTGGGTGIGAETAMYFAQAGAARIALMGRRLQPLQDTKDAIEAKYDTKVFVASTDVTKRAEVEKAFSDFGIGGKIDVLISNAAKSGPIGAIKDIDGDEIVDAMYDNAKGAVNVARGFLRYAADNAVVVEVNSNAAHVNFTAGFSSYCVAKFATYRFWDCFALEFPRMRVYHIHPGVVDTDMNRAVGGVKAIGYEDKGKCCKRLEYQANDKD
jgi:NAD(P)-dependent dehydrogenase (short-subunit alcohol dehydrogenase family)